jgi:hypothetical protein
MQWGLAAALLAIVRAMPEAGGTRTIFGRSGP